MPRASSDSKPKKPASFNIVIVGQNGRLAYEAILFAASLRRSDPGFSGRLFVGEPQPGRRWQSDPRIGKADIMQGLAEDEPGPAMVYSAEDVRIQLYGDTAVLAFRLLGQASEGEQELLQFFNTGTFVKAGGEWRAVAWQATRIPEE